MPLAPGTKLGPYEVLSQLGAGGMGEVYRASDRRLDRTVAVKVLSERLARDPDALARFHREAKAVAALSHPNILSLFDVGEEGDVVYAVTELLEGETLRSLLDRERLAEPRVLEIARALTEGLAAAHAKGIVHRDLKPENVFISADGRVKILDFGLARQTLAPAEGEVSQAPTLEVQTEPGVVLGTLGYMSPEQVRGMPADARSDLFSLGCIVYEMAAGRRAFARPTPAESLAAILRDPPGGAETENADSLSPSLDRVTHRCLEKDPERRFQSARDLGFALGEIATGRSPVPSMPSTALPATRRRYGVALGVAAILGLAVVVGLRLRRPPPSSAPRAGIRSVAVLSIENLTGDSAQEPMADGLTEALINDLGRVRDLRVTSRSAVVGFQKARAPISEIARALDVEAVIEGSLERSGETRRVRVQLIDPRNGYQMWSDRFDYRDGDLFAAQDRISQGVVSALRPKLTASESESLRSPVTKNLEAFDLYVRGKLRSRRENRDDNQAAIDYLDKAIALDPGFAAAQAELARALALRVFYFAPGDRASAERASVAVEKALALAPTLGEAHYARALLLWSPANHFPHEQVIRGYRRAIELTPSLDDAHHQLALVYFHVGLFDEATAELKSALAIDPSNTLARYRMGVVLLYQGRNSQALPILGGMPREFNPSLWTYQLATVQSALGRAQEARATVEDFLKLKQNDHGGVVAGIDALIRAKAGDAPGADEAIERAIQSGKSYGHFHHTAFTIASAHAVLGRDQEATKWLRSAAEDGFPCYPLFASDPNLDRVRKSPEYVELLAALKEQWEGYRNLR